MTKGKALAKLSGGQLSLLDKLGSFLEEASTIAEVKRVRDTAEALRTLAKQVGAGLEVQNECAEWKLRSERAAGEMLAGMDRAKAGDNQWSAHDEPTYRSLGIDRNAAQRWLRLAAWPLERFEGHITDVKGAGRELTTNGALQLAKLDRPAPVRRRQGPSADPARFDDPKVRILCRDARDFHGDEGHADLAVFSPPYNVGKKYDGDDGGDALPHDEWCELLATSGKVLADGWGVSRICVNTPTGIYRKPYTALLPSVMKAFEQFECEGIITWDKGAATVAGRTSWGSWCNPNAPSLRDRTEIIAVFRTGNPIAIPEGALEVAEREGSRLQVSPWLDDVRFPLYCQDLWQMAPAGREFGHPCPFPPELPERLIRLYCWPGGTVIDPFAGSGSTGVAALRLGANAILIDKSEAYVDLMHERLQAEAGDAAWERSSRSAGMSGEGA